MRARLGATALLILLTMSAATYAQEFPSKTVRIMVPFGPGSGPDVVARALSSEMSKELGQSVVVENKAGAGGNLAAQAVLGEKRDGHALLLSGSSNVSTNPVLFSNAGFATKDFRLVAPLADVTIFLFASAKANVRTVQEAVDLIRAQPNKLNYSAPTGTPHHMAGEQFTQLAALDWERVSFRDPSQVINEMLSGSVQFAFSLMPAMRAYVDDGRIRVIGVASAKRASTHPDVPAIGETVAGFAEGDWFALFAPSDTPPAAFEKLAAAAAKARDSADAQTRFKTLGMTATAGSREDYETRMQDDARRRGELIRARNLKLD